MAALIDREKRERNKRLKKQRIKAILDAGLRAFVRFAYVDVDLDQVRKLADVPQGKPEMYFGSREVLFLEVFVRQAGPWFEELRTALEKRPGEVARAELAELLAASLEARPELLRLLGLLHVVLDQNLDMVSGSLFLRQLHGWMQGTGEAMERACAGLGAGRGFQILNRFVNYGACLYSACHPTGAFAMMVQDDDLGAFQMDLATELRDLAARLVDAEKE